MLRLHREHDAAPFQVGPRNYAVRIARGPIVLDGDACMGICDPANREILLAHDLAPHLRLEVLLHELAHAFIFAFGFPRDVEAFCDFHASVSQQTWRDLNRCGGLDALLALAPGEELRLVDSADTAAA
jgi:hypothetical protein